jgi:Na+-transporting methylmalonyl-CoA/oxaloacetate decarboxylase gamma subunit
MEIIALLLVVLVALLFLLIVEVWFIGDRIIKALQCVGEIIEEPKTVGGLAHSAND